MFNKVIASQDHTDSNKLTDYLEFSLDMTDNIPSLETIHPLIKERWDFLIANKIIDKEGTGITTNQFSEEFAGQVPRIFSNPVRTKRLKPGEGYKQLAAHETEKCFFCNKLPTFDQEKVARFTGGHYNWTLYVNRWPLSYEGAFMLIPDINVKQNIHDAAMLEDVERITSQYLGQDAITFLNGKDAGATQNHIHFQVVLGYEPVFLINSSRHTIQKIFGERFQQSTKINLLINHEICLEIIGPLKIGVTFDLLAHWNIPYNFVLWQNKHYIFFRHHEYDPDLSKTLGTLELLGICEHTGTLFEHVGVNLEFLHSILEALEKDQLNPAEKKILEEILAKMHFGNQDKIQIHSEFDSIHYRLTTENPEHYLTKYAQLIFNNIKLGKFKDENDQPYKKYYIERDTFIEIKKLVIKNYPEGNGLTSEEKLTKKGTVFIRQDPAVQSFNKILNQLQHSWFSDLGLAVDYQTIINLRELNFRLYQELTSWHNSYKDSLSDFQLKLRKQVYQHCLSMLSPVIQTLLFEVLLGYSNQPYTYWHFFENYQFTDDFRPYTGGRYEDNWSSRYPHKLEEIY